MQFIKIKNRFLTLFFVTVTNAATAQNVTIIPLPVKASPTNLSKVDNGKVILLGVTKYINNGDTLLLDVTTFQRDLIDGRLIQDMGPYPLYIKFNVSNIKPEQVLQLIDKYNFFIVNGSYLCKKILFHDVDVPDKLIKAALPDYLHFSVESLQIN